MARRVFYSFHYAPDAWRASQVRNIGVVEGNKPASDNDWESITRGGDRAIQAWIDGQMNCRSCTVVLVGSQTANRKWIDYEIEKTWKEKKGLLAVYIHNLIDSSGMKATKGTNPFSGFTLGEQKKPLSSVVRAYDPPYTDSKQVYEHIANNLSAWIEEAVAIRNGYQ